MMWHNDWVWHNLDERKNCGSSQFIFGIQPRSFKKMTFKESSYYTAKKIYDEYKNVYISLSGGPDSLFVTKTFHEMGIPVTAVIIDTEANKGESIYAFDYCEKNNIKTKVFSMSFKDLYKYYLEKQVYRVTQWGLNTTSTIIAGLYAKENGGISLSGEFLLAEYEPTICCNDFDFVRDLYVKTINFFYYTEEIAYAMAIEAELPYQENKNKLYGFEYREKFYTHDEDINRLFTQMRKHLQKEVVNSNYQYVMCTFDEFVHTMEEKIV